MSGFELLAKPWWVNLLILAPAIAAAIWWRRGIALSRRQLILAALFSVAFGFVEAVVVIYLRAAVGLLPGAGGALTDFIRSGASSLYHQTDLLQAIPAGLYMIELIRNAATLVVIVTLALLSAYGSRERSAIFLWAFAWWDIAYYAWLYAIVRWPESLLTPDVLFLIPAPWFSQVWFPLLVSGLTVATVLVGRRRGQR